MKVKKRELFPRLPSVKWDKTRARIEKCFSISLGHSQLGLKTSAALGRVYFKKIYLV